MHHPRRSSDMFAEHPTYLNSHSRDHRNMPIGHNRNTELHLLDGRIPHTISFVTTGSTAANHHPIKPKGDFVPQKPARLSPSELLAQKVSLRHLITQKKEDAQTTKALPKRNPTPKRTKPRRQSGAILNRSRNSSPKAARNMMRLMRTDSDRQILRNTLERKFQKRGPMPASA